MATLHDLKGRRLDLALVFRQKRTAKEAARALGTETGSVFGLIKRMHGDGILEADSDPYPPTRGTQYVLSMEGQAALERVLEQSLDERQEPGRLERDQRLLIVTGPELAGFNRVIADPGLSSAIAWAAWIGASWLLALAPESEQYARDKLAVALERGGYSCERARVDGLVSGIRLREQAVEELEQEAFR